MRTASGPSFVGFDGLMTLAGIYGDSLEVPRYNGYLLTCLEGVLDDDRRWHPRPCPQDQSLQERKVQGIPPVFQQVDNCRPCDLTAHHLFMSLFIRLYTSQMLLALILLENPVLFALNIHFAHTNHVKQSYLRLCPGAKSQFPGITIPLSPSNLALPILNINNYFPLINPYPRASRAHLSRIGHVENLTHLLQLLASRLHEEINHCFLDKYPSYKNTGIISTLWLNIRHNRMPTQLMDNLRICPQRLQFRPRMRLTLQLSPPHLPHRLALQLSSSSSPIELCILLWT